MNDSLRRSSFVTIGGLALLSAAFVFLVFLPGQRRTAQVRREIADAERAIRDVPLRVAELESLRGDAGRRRSYADSVLERMPTDFDVHGLVRQVASLAERTRVKVSRIEPLPAVDHETYRELPFRLGFQGDAEGVARFLRGLESLPWLTSFPELSLNAESGRGGNLPDGDLHFAVYAARRDPADSADFASSSSVSSADTKQK
jgi:type IV pilus assembly protein PilO